MGYPATIVPPCAVLSPMRAAGLPPIITVESVITFFSSRVAVELLHHCRVQSLQTGQETRDRGRNHIVLVGDAKRRNTCADLGSPLVIFEGFRIFYFFDGNKLVVLLSGFQKKTQKTPPDEINKAVRLKTEYYNEKEKEKKK